MSNITTLHYFPLKKGYIVEPLINKPDCCMFLITDSTEKMTVIQQVVSASCNDMHRGWCLPEDLTIEILVRLQIKSVARCKLVSKSWNSLISKPTFAKAYDKLSSPLGNPPLTLLISPGERVFAVTLPNCSASTHTGGSASASAETDSNNMVDNVKGLMILNPLNPPFTNDQGCIEKGDFCFGSSDGIVCIYIHRTRLIYLWNPTTNHCREIPLPVVLQWSSKTHKMIISRNSWFGFVPSLSDHKILLITRRELERWRDGCSEQDEQLRGHVYSMKDASWRKLDSSLDALNSTPDVGIDNMSACSFMNGALHSIGHHAAESFLRFDFNGETFGNIPLSLTQEKRPNRPGREVRLSAETFSFMEHKRSLCLWKSYLECDKPTWRGADPSDVTKKMELWMLEQYGEWKSWKKLRTLEYFMGLGRPTFVGLSYTGHAILWDKNYSTKAGYNDLVLTNISDGEQSDSARVTCKFSLPPSMLTCTSSLTSPFLLSSVD